MSFDDNWLDIVRREAGIVANQRQEASILVATGYDPDKHAVKGILQPHGVETGWVALPAHHVGNGWGIAVGPQVGTAEDNKGDQFHIAFLGGDPNTPIAIARHFVVDKDNKPPRVKSGEIILKHQNGAMIFWDENNNVTHTGANGQTVQLTSGGAVHVNASSGEIKNTAKGSNYMHLKDDGTAELSDGSDDGKVHCKDGKVVLGGDSGPKVLTVAGPAKSAYAPT